MTDLSYPYPHSTHSLGEASESVHYGFIRKGDEDNDTSSLVDANFSPVSPVSQLTSLERLELHKLRQEVADLRTELAKHKHESCEAIAASAASTLPNSSLPESGCSPISSCDVPSPSLGLCPSPKHGRLDWVLQERAYGFARSFFLDEPGKRTLGELRAALLQVPEVAEFFSEYFPSFNGEPAQVVDWNDFVQAYIQHCKRPSDNCSSSPLVTCTPEFKEATKTTPPRNLELLPLQDYKECSCAHGIEVRWIVPQFVGITKLKLRKAFQIILNTINLCCNNLHVVLQFADRLDMNEFEKTA